jgi:mannosyl-3-phosphoglycerate phosphatase
MTRKRKRVLIFTDLDGTLLDADNYSFKEALPALKEVKKRKIPLILCSSKTKAELELYQKKLKIEDPFISENGGAVFIPKGYFRQIPIGHKKKGKYLVLELGTPYQQIRRKFLEVFNELNLKAVSFGDLKAEEISSLLNLSKTEAKLARKREYDEPFYFLEKAKAEKIKLAEKEFNKSGLGLTSGGRLFHLTGGNDKGKAVKFLVQLYKSNWGNALLTIGLGDSSNDLSMLESVDIPVLIRKKDDSYEQNIIDKLKVNKAQGIGPRGWNLSVLDLIEKYDSKVS